MILAQVTVRKVKLLCPPTSCHSLCDLHVTDMKQYCLLHHSQQHPYLIIFPGLYVLNFRQTSPWDHRLHQVTVRAMGCKLT